MSRTQSEDMVIDWFRVVTDLNRVGLSDQTIANEIGKSRTSIVALRKGEANDLKFHEGERLIALWRQHMVPTLPMRSRYSPG